MTLETRLNALEKSTPAQSLKPCPFCGESGISFNPPDGAFRGSINCPACLVSMPREVNDDEELVDCWNHREPDPALLAEIERYRMVIAEAALNILDNPYGAIKDTLWMANGGSTMWAHLISELSDEIEFVGLPDDETLLRQWIAQKKAANPPNAEDV